MHAVHVSHIHGSLSIAPRAELDYPERGTRPLCMAVLRTDAIRVLHVQAGELGGGSSIEVG